MGIRWRVKALVIVPCKYVDIEEVKGLVREAGYEPEHIVKICRYPDPRFYVGKGKVKELKDLVKELEIEKVIVFDMLKPRQVIGLMRELKLDVIDKVQLILEIFALHAGSKEAKLQIELARLRHELPLIREWVRRTKLGELPGFLGPGGYAAEAYYRFARRRLAKIRKELEELRQRRQFERQKRKEHGLPHIAIAGYTNAGKTTVFNVLTHLSKPTGPEMFTTLSPKSAVAFINGRKVILVDTVGFIRDVPVEVIEAFYATLEEIVDSDGILLVVDTSESEENIISKTESSIKIIKELGVVSKPIIIAANKIDLVNTSLEKQLDLIETISKRNYDYIVDVIPISAAKRHNIDTLRDAIWKVLTLRNTKSMYLE